MRVETWLFFYLPYFSVDLISHYLTFLKLFSDLLHVTLIRLSQLHYMGFVISFQELNSLLKINLKGISKFIFFNQMTFVERPKVSTILLAQLDHFGLVMLVRYLELVLQVTNLSLEVEPYFFHSHFQGRYFHELHFNNFLLLKPYKGTHYCRWRESFMRWWGTHVLGYRFFSFLSNCWLNSLIVFISLDRFLEVICLLS